MAPLPYKQAKRLPWLSTEEMVEVDRLMEDVYGIQLIQMMENAGRCLAITAKHMLSDDLRGKIITVLAGTGGNGGGAMVAARRLHMWGAEVEVYVTAPDKLTPIPLHQYHILKKLNIILKKGGDLAGRKGKPSSLILDGIIGYSLSGNPRGIAAEMIHWANGQEGPVLALDTPSGISLTSGNIFEPVIRAAATMTIALPKRGLFTAEVKEIRGDLYVGDISVPAELYAEESLRISLQPIFTQGDVVRLMDE
ncbi:MAG: NAD(P)H-hydrate epimerase [Bacteroidota bacterium]